MKFFLILIFVWSSVFADEAHHEVDARDLEIQSCKIDELEDIEAKESMQKWMHGDFGLIPYKTNYILPFGYRNGGEYKSYVVTDEYVNYETELQVSLKMYMGTGMLGFNESYYLQ